MHSKKSAISLSWVVCAFQPGPASNRWGPQSDPSISSITTAIMITTSNSPRKRSGMPNHYAGDLLLTMAISGLSRVRTELFKLTIVQTLTPHPVQMHRQFASHRYLRDLPSPAHGQVEVLAAPMPFSAHRDLRRFYQQEPQQCVALFADVSQTPPIPAGFLRRNQTHIAGDLLATTETFGSANHQLEGQCRQYPDSGMRHQSPRDGPLRYFLLERSRQLLDLRRQLVEYVEQVLATPAGPGSKY